MMFLLRRLMASLVMKRHARFVSAVYYIDYAENKLKDRRSLSAAWTAVSLAK